MFELNHTAEIKAINVAKGKSDEAPVCVTIGLEFETVGPAPVAAALGCREEDLKALFNEAGESLFTGIDQVESWASFEDSHKLGLLGFRCDVAKVSKLRIKPRSEGKFSLACNVQLQDPPDHVIEKVATSLHGEYLVKLESSGELPLNEAA